MIRSSEHFLKNQFKRLSLLKAAPQDPDAIRAWAEALAPAHELYGDKAFAEAVTKCLRTMEFFPMPTVFREQIEAPQEWREERNRLEAERNRGIREYQNSDEGKRDLEEFKAKLRELGRKYGIVRSEERGEEEKRG